MKILYRINQIIFITTLILYLTIFLGLYAQIVLGGVQVLSAVILLFCWYKLPKNSKNQLSIYWIIITLYGLIWLMDIKALDDYFIITVMIIPMAIAGYFLYILYSIQNTDIENSTLIINN